VSRRNGPRRTAPRTRGTGPRAAPTSPDGPARRLTGVRGEDEGSSRLHEPRLLGDPSSPAGRSIMTFRVTAILAGTRPICICARPFVVDLTRRPAVIGGGDAPARGWLCDPTQNRVICIRPGRDARTEVAVNNRQGSVAFSRVGTAAAGHPR
jgi:hypothetical protein